jgi:hypothetical protein
MKWADFNQADPNNIHDCQVYNWSDDQLTTPPLPNSQLKKCRQDWLEPWTREGGIPTGVDVDGFTFPSREYQVRWVSAPGCVGGSCSSDLVYNLQAGVWVKFAGYNSVTCEDKSGRSDGKPVCYIH